MSPFDPAAGILSRHIACDFKSLASPFPFFCVIIARHESRASQSLCDDGTGLLAAQSFQFG
jgi:hypothetical protein